MRRFGRVMTALALAASLVPGVARAERPADFRRIETSSSGAVARDGTGVVRLTLDPELQRRAERLLAAANPHEGAIVASDPRTGRILVWATRGGGRDQVSAASAPSASLFKVVTAAALVEKGAASAGTRQCYAGGEHDVRRQDVFGPAGPKARCPTLGQALGESINLVFAKLAVRHLSPGELEETARRLGFLGEVPIDVPVAASTVDVPTDPFGLARAAAGFWNGKLSPLGAMFAMQTLANDGERVRLHVIGGPDVVRESAGRALSVDTARELVRMLENTTRSGTAAKYFKRPDGSRWLPGIPVAAKTGTLIGGKPARMHSWFAGFAPSTSPVIAVAVMLGNDLKWHAKATEVGRDLLVAYFKRSDAGEARPRRRPTARR